MDCAYRPKRQHRIQVLKTEGGFDTPIHLTRECVIFRVTFCVMVGVRVSVMFRLGLGLGLWLVLWLALGASNE